MKDTFITLENLVVAFSDIINEIIFRIEEVINILLDK